MTALPNTLYTWEFLVENIAEHLRSTQDALRRHSNIKTDEDCMDRVVRLKDKLYNGKSRNPWETEDTLYNLAVAFYREKTDPQALFEEQEYSLSTGVWILARLLKRQEETDFVFARENANKF